MTAYRITGRDFGEPSLPDSVLAGFSIGDLVELTLDPALEAILIDAGLIAFPVSESSGSGISRTVSAISYAASITPALPTSGDATYNVGTLTGNITVNDPSGTPADGQIIKFRFVQDATGRTFTFGSGYSFGTDVQLAMFPTAASAKFEAAFEYDVTSLKWRAIGVIRGF